jgi:L-ascorbate metabolism protein UlaG (beta-lactamase superfamily)
MKKIISFAVMFLMMSLTVSHAGADEVKIKWFGQACFLLTLPDGKKIVTDPYGEKVGYDVPELSADIVTVTHEHFDHNNTALVKGEPAILSGLTEKGADYNKVDYKEDGLSIYTVQSYHDKEKGARRGKNAIFVIKIGEKKIVHLGDLGTTLDERQLSEIGKVDLVMIPVGGYYTIDAQEADKVIDQLKPGIVIPMHFKTDKVTKLPISDKKKFLKDKEPEEIKGNEYIFDLTKDYSGLNYVVLDYK